MPQSRKPMHLPKPNQVVLNIQDATQRRRFIDIVLSAQEQEQARVNTPLPTEEERAAAAKQQRRDVKATQRLQNQYEIDIHDIINKARRIPHLHERVILMDGDQKIDIAARPREINPDNSGVGKPRPRG